MSRSIKAVRTRAPVVQPPKPRRDWQKDYEWYHANSSMFGNPNEGDTEEAERTVTPDPE